MKLNEIVKEVIGFEPIVKSCHRSRKGLISRTRVSRRDCVIISLGNLADYHRVAGQPWFACWVIDCDYGWFDDFADFDDFALILWSKSDDVSGEPVTLGRDLVVFAA